jgi:DNA polymerase-3 subunit delta'
VSPLHGHAGPRAKFERAVAANRLGHAYLLLGPDGIGKKRFAVEMAKALLCEGSPVGLMACGRCASCPLVDAGTHPDLSQAGKPEDKSELPIKVVRDLTSTLGLSPTRGRRRIAILDDLDWINEEAANAFLKSLEEPAPGTILFLIGTAADRQLPTILSRCQIVRFDRLTDDDVAKVLLDHGQKATEIDRLVRLADGSPGQALALADPAIGEFRAAMFALMAAVPFRRSALIESWLRFIEGAGKEAPAQRTRARLLLGQAMAGLRSAVRVAVGSERGDVADAATLARYGPDALLQALEAHRQADDRIDRRVPVPVSLEAMVDRLGRCFASPAA